jgi:hypothetical protein
MEPNPERLDTAELIAAAGPEEAPSARSLELWRYRGLLPRPERQRGTRARWLYPVGTERQLERLLHWRRRTRSHDQILLALWLEGFPIDPERVRGALASFVSGWEKMIATETAGSGSGEEAALVDSLARRVARMRGTAAFPRTARMRLGEREAACGYMLATMLDLEEEIARRKSDLVHLERMLGIRSGRDGGLSAQLGLREPGGAAMRLPTPTEVRTAIEEASAMELEVVRRVVSVLLFWLPPLLPALLGDQAVKAAHLVDLVTEIFTDPPPAAFPFLVAVPLVLLHAKDPATAELQTHLDSLDPSVVGGELAKLVATAESAC